MKKLYTIKAGSRAKEILLDEGLSPDRVAILAGASGGPKWLVLAGIDDYLPDFLSQRKSTSPLHLAGSSIGSWRLAAYAASKPSASLKKFEDAYKAQTYNGKPTINDVTEESQKILKSYLSREDYRHILNHEKMKLHIITALSRGTAFSDNRLMLGPHMAITYIANALSRSMTHLCFKGITFSTSPNAVPFHAGALLEKKPVQLSEANLPQAILASGSIPLVMKGIKDISGAPSGTYRDGGIVHYHLDLDFHTAEDELVLFPHFYEYIIPGWFDRAPLSTRFHKLPKDNVVLISPSAEFIEKLKLGRIPDRTDFKHFFQRDRERMDWWNSVTDLSREMGSQLFNDISGKLSDSDILSLE